MSKFRFRKFLPKFHLLTRKPGRTVSSSQDTELTHLMVCAHEWIGTQSLLWSSSKWAVLLSIYKQQSAQTAIKVCHAFPKMHRPARWYLRALIKASNYTLA